MRNYLKKTRSPFYSLIFTLPLFFIYEIGMLSVSHADMPVLRNGADVFMRQILGALGLWGMQGFGFISLVAIVVIVVMQVRAQEAFRIRGKYLATMILESAAWMTGLYLVLSLSEHYILGNSVEGLLHQVILAVGAGIYEEILFRVLLVGGAAIIIRFIFSWGKPMQVMSAIIVSAVIFSLFHFIGSVGDEYSFRLFLYRTIAGIYLGGLYLLRGFGITAWTHSLYDVVVFLGMQLAG